MVRSKQCHQLCADSGEMWARFAATYWRTLDQRRVSAGAPREAQNDAMQTFGGYGVTVNDDNARTFHETRQYLVASISTKLSRAYLAEREPGLPRSF